jgi:hypothetical protein
MISFVRYCLIALFLTCSISLPGQVKRSKIKSLFFLEAGGPGFGLSANYQPKLSLDSNLNLFSARMGLGVLGPFPGRDGGSALFTLPTGILYRPKYKRWEYGAGITLFYFTNTGLESPGYYASVAWYPGPDSPILPFAGVAVLLE